MVFVGFVARRLARIYPLYFVLFGGQLAYVFVMEAAFHGTERWVPVSVADPAIDIPANFLLVHSLGIAPSIITQAWSVSTEVAAYLCFPVLVMLVMAHPRIGQRCRHSVSGCRGGR